jgi:hypothetical protein
MFPPQPSSQPEPPPWLGVDLWKTGHGGPGLDGSYDIGLALSGGGHRAALFGLGVLMALRDAGKIDAPVDRANGVGRMTQIASVSGGSITNAVLAREYFRHTAERSKPEEGDALWESATRQLFQMIVEVGILPAWIWIVVGLFMLPPLAVAVMLIIGSPPAATWLLIGATAWLSLALLRGKLIESLIRAAVLPVPGAVRWGSTFEGSMYVDGGTRVLRDRPRDGSTRLLLDARRGARVSAYSRSAAWCAAAHEKASSEVGRARFVVPRMHLSRRDN